MSLPAHASLDDQDWQYAPPTIAAATCIAPLAINKELLSTSKSRTPSLFFLPEQGLVSRVYILHHRHQQHHLCLDQPSDNCHHHETVRFLSWPLLQHMLQCLLLLPRLPVLLMLQHLLQCQLWSKYRSIITTIYI